MDRWVTPPKLVTSPTWGPSPSCKHALGLHLYGEKLYRAEGSPLYSSYPGRANFSYISLQNLANRLIHEKQKLDLARRVACLTGSRFCDDRVTLLSRQVFLHINTLVCSGGSTRSRRDNRDLKMRGRRRQVKPWLKSGFAVFNLHRDYSKTMLYLESYTVLCTSTLSK